jgi:tetratricopeptide (TPR) repeat protein
MPSLKQPDADALAKVIQIDTPQGLVSMAYGQAIGLVNELITRNQLQQAITILDQLSKQFPDDLIPKAQLLHVRVIQRDYENILKTADLIGPSALLDSVIAALCIRGYRQIGKIQTAMELAKQAEGQFLNDATIQNEIALCLLASGKKEEAVDTFDKVISIDPEFIQAYFHRAPLTAGQLSSVQLEEMLRISKTPGIQPEHLAMLNFAIAWAYDRIDADNHFKYLHKANMQMASIRP